MEITSPLATLADELGDLEQELAPLKAKIKRAETLRAALRGAHKDADAAGSFTVWGARWSVLLGPCGNESIVDTRKLYELAGADTFLKIAAVSLKAISENCAPGVLGTVVSTQMSGRARWRFCRPRSRRRR